jgi:hypothetical protein
MDFKKKKKLALPTVFAIAATRGMLGLGAGLLLSSRVPRRKRLPVGLTLVGIGLATTFPLASQVLRQ